MQFFLVGCVYIYNLSNKKVCVCVCIYVSVGVVLINILVLQLGPPNKNSWLRPYIGIFLWWSYGLFGWRGEGGAVVGSKVKLAKNKLILC